MQRADRIVRRIGRVIKDGRHDHLLLQLHQHGRRAVYSGYLHYAMRRGSQRAPGFAANLFREVFGDWPRPCDRGPPAPLPDCLTEEWVALRPKPRIIKIEKPAPLLDRIPPKQLKLDANGFVEGTLMKPTEDDFWFEWK